METITAIRERRAVKHYDPDFVIPEDQEKELLDLIRQSPTSFNIQNWRFVLLRGKELRKQVRAQSWNQAQLTDASLMFIICADLKAWDKEPKRYWQDAPQEVQDFMVPAIGDFYRDREWQQRDEAMRSAGIAAQTIMLTAKSMGYDSCPMIGFDPKGVGELINLPEDHVICMMVAVGKAAEPARSKGGYIPDEEVFITDKF